MKWSVTVYGQPPTVNRMYSAKIRTLYRDGIRLNVPQMVKSKRVEEYQVDAALQIRSARPSHWKPEGFVRITFRLFLARDIDADNALKALSDAIQSAIGVNDRWFLPNVESKQWGMKPRDARVEIDFEDLPVSSSPGPLRSPDDPPPPSSTSSSKSRTASVRSRS